MSQDDRSNDAGMRDRADGIDDGMIHEWLDGELDSAKATELEALVTSSPVFAARVAEARGLLAASSRILSALDEVPGNVLPNVATTEARPLAGPLARPLTGPARHAVKPVARGWSARRWTGIAALLMVGVTGVVIARREPETTRLRESVAIASEDGAAEEVVTQVGASLDSGAAAASESLAASGLAVADAARSEPAVSRMARAPNTGSASAARSREASAQDTRAQDMRSSNATPPAAGASVSPASLAEVAGRVAAAQAKAAVESGSDAVRGDSLSAQRQLNALALKSVVPSFASAQRERVANAPTSVSTARGESRAAVSVQGGAAPASAARLMMRAEPSSAFDDVPVPPSDILAGDLLLAVQRVRCTPVCGQLRIEIARDGRVRSWRQSLGSSGSPDTATLTERELADLKRTVDELRLDTLPAMLRLDGAQCRSVGSLRESLRVEFVHNNELRRVMGLPWCSDGTHVMDKAAAAIEAAADSAINRASGASSRYW